MKNIVQSLFFLSFILVITQTSWGMVEISGKENLKIFEDKNQWVAKTETTVWHLTKDKISWVLKDSKQKILARATGTPGKEVKLQDDLGKEIATLKCENESCRLFSGSTLLFRIKEKADKTNLYDGKDKRIFKVKTKPYGFSVKHATDSSREWKIQGIKEIKGAGLFAAPLTLEQRALLWRAWSL